MENKKVFIGNLDFAVTEEEVRDLLSKYGTVAVITMRRKKGYAMVEMGDAAEAAEAIEKLNGAMYKDREIRISPALKPGKAKSLSVRKFKERGEGFSREKAGGDPGTDTQGEGNREALEPKPYERKEAGNTRHSHGKPKDDFNSKKRTPGFKGRTAAGNKKENSGVRTPRRDRWATERPVGFPPPSEKVWSGEKPTYISKPSRDDERKSYGKSGRREPGGRSGEGSSGSGNRPARKYPPKRSGADGNSNKVWTPEKTAYSGRPSGDGERPGYGRSPKPDRDSRSGGRSTGPGDRPFGKYSKEKPVSTGHPKKEWSPRESSGSSRQEGESWKEGPGKNKPSRDRTRDYSKSRPAGGSQDRFAKSSGPKPGGTGRKGPSGSSRPKPRGGPGGNVRNSRTKKD